MAKLSAISKPREQNPQIKASELLDRIFMLQGVHGPFEAKRQQKFENKPFLVFTVALTDPTPDELDAGGVFDLLMSHIPGQRSDLLAYFTSPDNAPEPVGPLSMTRIDVGQPQPMYAFIDVEPAPVSVGNGSKGKAK